MLTRSRRRALVAHGEGARTLKVGDGFQVPAQRPPTGKTRMGASPIDRTACFRPTPRNGKTRRPSHSAQGVPS
jgi:hypothetical protein